MFTGIVEELGKAESIEQSVLSISSDKILSGLEEGESVAVNGICLTINQIVGRQFYVDVMPETFRRTNLGDLQNGSLVNLERSLTLNSRLGGHIMQGHVDGRGEVVSVSPDGEAWIMGIEASHELMPYIVSKGFIGVDGASLTVVDRTTRGFTISLVSYTWTHTTLSSREVGDMVNLEVDILAKYVEQLVKGNAPLDSLYQSISQQGSDTNKTSGGIG